MENKVLPLPRGCIKVASCIIAGPFIYLNCVNFPLQACLCKPLAGHKGNNSGAGAYIKQTERNFRSHISGTFRQTHPRPKQYSICIHPHCRKILHNFKLLEPERIHREENLFLFEYESFEDKAIPHLYATVTLLGKIHFVRYNYYGLAILFP